MRHRDCSDILSLIGLKQKPSDKSQWFGKKLSLLLPTPGGWTGIIPFFLVEANFTEYYRSSQIGIMLAFASDSSDNHLIIVAY